MILIKEDNMWTTKNMPDLPGVSGADTSDGFETAKALCAQAAVTMAWGDEINNKQVMERIQIVTKGKEDNFACY